ncbi:hypothetical protein [Providencia alcalifaciens]|uniref:hypothetical protein n=1 Tax=Providencia alcalifaciens TaxID=126385 RepID=UPI002B060FCE|nr:hypothetical protein [Providencia alcalifaciens]
MNDLFIIMDSPYYTYIVETLIDQAENHRGTIMNIAQRLKNEGIEEGEKKNQLKVALMSLQLGLDIDVIRKLTGLSDSEIQALN